MNQSTTTTFTPTEVRKIKRKLWYGEHHELIADHYGCSLSVINAIARGMRWKDAEFPDGSTGGMGQGRLLEISRARVQAHAEMRPRLSARVKAILMNGVSS